MKAPEGKTRDAGLCPHGNLRSSCPLCSRSSREWRELRETHGKTYTIEDVRQLQEAAAAFEELNEREGEEFRLSDNAFYEFASTGAFVSRAVPESRREQRAALAAEPIDRQAYERFELKAFRRWRDNLLNNAAAVIKERPALQSVIDELREIEEPRSLGALHELLRDHPELNGSGALQYQDGLNEEGMYSNPFLHVQGHRLSGYAYNRHRTEVRFYLNPPMADIPKLTDRFLELAEAEDVPFYLKFVDFSLQEPTEQDCARLDRLLFYTDQATAPRIFAILERLRQEQPAWFDGRPVPPLTGRLGEGIGVAENPNQYQKEHFGRSFNDVRAQFLREVWRDALAGVVARQPGLRLRGGRTVKELFLASVREYDRGHLKEMVSAGFDPEKMGRDAARAFDGTMMRLIPRLAPSLKAEALLPLVLEQMRRKAAKYDIDADNIAFNARPPEERAGTGEAARPETASPPEQAQAAPKAVGGRSAEAPPLLRPEKAKDAAGPSQLWEFFGTAESVATLAEATRGVEDLVAFLTEQMKSVKVETIEQLAWAGLVTQAKKAGAERPAVSQETVRRAAVTALQARRPQKGA